MKCQKLTNRMKLPKLIEATNRKFLSPRSKSTICVKFTCDQAPKLNLSIPLCSWIKHLLDKVTSSAGHHFITDAFSLASLYLTEQ